MGGVGVWVGAAGGAVADGGGEEQEVAQRLLETMVVPQEDIGGLPLGRRVSPRQVLGYGAAQESNLPSDGLRRLTGFEDRLGHRAHAAPRPA